MVRHHSQRQDIRQRTKRITSSGIMNPIVIIIHNPTDWNAKDSNGDFNETARANAEGVGAGHQRGQGGSIVICVSGIEGLQEDRGAASAAGRG